MRGSFKWMALLASVALAACAPEDNPGGGGGGGDDDDDGNNVVDAGGNGGFIDATELPEGPDAATAACDKMDILFVIDNSGSMAEEQDNLAANFPMFAQLIDDYMNSNGLKLDYHVGVTTTDKNYTITQLIGPPTSKVGSNGALLAKGKEKVNGTWTDKNCPMPSGRKFLQRGDAELQNTFSCIAKQGINGDANEMPLQAMKLALVDRVADGTNAGFLRPDALLAVIVLTDENDCSVTATSFDNPFVIICANPEPAANYVPILDQVKGGERGRWAFAAIAGPGPGRCSSTYGGADEAVRLKEFIGAAGGNTVLSSICDADLANSLTTAFEKFSAACEAIPPVD